MALLKLSNVQECAVRLHWIEGDQAQCKCCNGPAVPERKFMARLMPVFRQSALHNDADG